MPTKVYFGGAVTDQDTADALTEAQRLAGVALLLTQGSYSTTVSASAGTHDGGGVVDINVSGWNYTTIWNVLTACRRVGLIAWYRTPSQGFAYHIHVVRRDCGDLSVGARAQVVQYLDGLNGLAGRGPDDGPQGFLDVTWGTYQSANSNINPALTEDAFMAALTEAEQRELLTRVRNIEIQNQFPGGGGATWGQALGNELGEIRKDLKNIYNQQIVPGQPFQWLDALNDKLDAIQKKLGV